MPAEKTTGLVVRTYDWSETSRIAVVWTREFGKLRRDLRALYAGYYVAELLGDGTQEYDPHPALFEFSLDTLRKLSAGGDVMGLVSAYELGWLGELGLRPVLDRCAACQTEGLPPGRLVFSAIAGGLVCPTCAPAQRDRRVGRPDAPA